MILVDDEDEVRGRISSRISQASGFRVVGTAGNGYDALELIDSLSPDVVLTDIKMPYIDGIELATIIRREYPTVRVGFITGYNEFDYARQAVQLQVRSYLTKPLTEADIIEFLTQLKTELDQEYENRYSRESILKEYKNSVPILIENSLAALLTAAKARVNPLVEQLKGYGVFLDDRPYVLSVVRIERNSLHWDVLEFEKLKLSVRGNIEKSLGTSALDFYSFLFHEFIIFILKENGTRFLQEVDSVLYQTIRTVEHFLKVRVFIGVSNLRKGFNDLGGAYEEASRAYETGRLQNLGQLVYASQLSRQPMQSITLTQAETQDLQHALRYGTPEQLAELLNDVQKRAKTADFRLLMMGITNLLVHYAQAVGVEIQEVLSTDILETVLRIGSLEEFMGWALQAGGQIREESQAEKRNNGAQLLEIVIQYLQANFANKNLTMQQVCDEKGLSVSYLSQLFKKYKNTTFVTFLTAIRMEYAQEKLRLSGKRIVEVAEACGYRDVYYFSHCFKKHTGLSPKAYREEHA